jgi:hypothetical protein
MLARIACLAAVFLAAPTFAQESDRIEALGTFDQIAIECARGGSEADVDAFRLKLWHSYLGGDKAPSPQEIKDTIATLRQQLSNDGAEGLRKQYWAARVAIPQAKSLSAAQEREFYKLCDAPKVQGLPDRK